MVKTNTLAVSAEPSMMTIAVNTAMIGGDAIATAASLVSSSMI